jgi:pyridoxal phosphate enzyme (YggS family)
MTYDAVSKLEHLLAVVRTKQKRSALARDSVNILAVSKTHDATCILPLLEAGHSDFAENRVQEAQAKWPSLKAQYPNVRLHLIGPLQSNKVKDAALLFDSFHALDRVKIADKLNEECCKLGKMLDVFIQVNIGEEPQKSGLSPAELPGFITQCRAYDHLRLQGLMCVPPSDEQPAPHFALLRKLAQEHELEALSMGMSGDFETAIAMGATHIRIGTALFGERQK